MNYGYVSTRLHDAMSQKSIIFFSYCQSVKCVTVCAYTLYYFLHDEDSMGKILKHEIHLEFWIQNSDFKTVEDWFLYRYHYSLKMYTYERVRARNFARTWGFVQCSQAIPIAIGVPISGECLHLHTCQYDLQMCAAGPIILWAPTLQYLY